jgi:hypothetical protein
MHDRTILSPSIIVTDRNRENFFRRLLIGSARFVFGARNYFYFISTYTVTFTTYLVPVVCYATWSDMRQSFQTV